MEVKVYYKFRDPNSLRVQAVLQRLNVAVDAYEVFDGQIRREGVKYINKAEFEEQFSVREFPVVKVGEQVFAGDDALRKLLDLRGLI